MDKKITELKRKVKAGDTNSVAPLISAASKTGDESLRDAFTTISKSLTLEQLNMIYQNAVNEICRREIDREEKQENDLDLQRTIPICIGTLTTKDLGKMSLAKFSHEATKFIQELKRKPRSAPINLGVPTYGDVRDAYRKALGKLEEANTDEIFITAPKIRIWLGQKESVEDAERRSNREKKRIKKELTKTKREAALLKKKLAKLNKQIAAAEDG